MAGDLNFRLFPNTQRVQNRDVFNRAWKVSYEGLNRSHGSEFHNSAPDTQKHRFQGYQSLGLIQFGLKILGQVTTKLSQLHSNSRNKCQLPEIS